MIYFVIVIICVFPIMEILKKLDPFKKYKNLNLLFLIIFPIIFISNLIIPLKVVNYEIFSTIIILTLFLWILFLIYKMFIIFKKNNIKFNINFKKDLFIPLFKVFLLILTTILCFLFQELYYDTTVYVAFSSNFVNSIYSDENVLGGQTSSFYLITPMYYSYSVFFSDNLILAYTILTPLFMMYISFNIVDIFMDRFIKNRSDLIYLLLYFTCFISLIWFANLANTGWWFTSFIFLNSLLLYNKKNENYIFYTLIGYSFFSSTASMLSLPISIAFSVIYLIQQNGMRRTLKLSWLSLYFFILNLFAIININSFQLLFLSIPFISIFMFLLFYYLYSKFFKWKSINLELLMKTKTFHIGFLIIYIACILFTTIILCLNLSSQNEFFHSNLTWAYLTISIISLVIYLINFKKNNFNLQQLFILILLLNLMAILEFYFINTLIMDFITVNRILILLLGFGPVSQLPIIILSLMAFIYLLWWNIKETIYEFNIFKLVKEKITFIENPVVKNINYIKLPMFLSLTIFLSIWPNLLYVNELIKSFNLSKINDEIYFLSNADSKYLKSMNFNNFQKSYISDLLLFSILNSAFCATTFVNMTSINQFGFQKWVEYGFYQGMKYWNEKFPSEIINNSEKIETVNTMIGETIDKFPSYLLRNIYNQGISEINYFILKKDSEYNITLSNYLENNYNYQTIYNGDKINVLVL